MRFFCWQHRRFALRAPCRDCVADWERERAMLIRQVKAGLAVIEIIAEREGIELEPPPC